MNTFRKDDKLICSFTALKSRDSFAVLKFINYFALSFVFLQVLKFCGFFPPLQYATDNRR